MICEYCGKRHNGYYGSGRFCSETCARAYATLNSSKYKKIICCNCGKETIVKLNSNQHLCEQCLFKEKGFREFEGKIKGKYFYIKDDDLRKFYICQHYHINEEIIPELELRLKNKGFKKTEIKRNNKTFIKFISEETSNAFQKAGLKSSNIQAETRRSKNEIMFCRLCEGTFNNISHNEQLFNGWDADVILNDQKIAVLWNGPWHYKKIKEGQSLEQIKNRDLIKLNEIKKAGFKPYIIKDMGKENHEFVRLEFNKFRKYFKL